MSSTDLVFPVRRVGEERVLRLSSRGGGAGWQLELLLPDGTVEESFSIAELEQVLVGYAGGHFRKQLEPPTERHDFSLVFHGGAAPLPLSTGLEIERAQISRALADAQAGYLEVAPPAAEPARPPSTSSREMEVPARFTAPTSTSSSAVAREAEVETGLLLGELERLDFGIAAVSLRMARRMALVAKKQHSPAELEALRWDADGADSPSSGREGPPSPGPESDAALTEEQLAGRALSERAVHSGLLAQHEERAAKWARLVTTVALLPSQQAEAAPELPGHYRLQTALRLGARFLPIWRPAVGGDALDYGEEATALVASLDVQSGAFEILEVGETVHEVAFEQMPAVHLGYVSAHFRASCLGADPRTPPGSVVSVGSSGTAAGSAGSAGAGEGGDSEDEADGSLALPSERFSLCLTGLRDEPILPLYTETEADRGELATVLAAARAGRPLAPALPVMAGRLMRELGTFDWAETFCILVPGHAVRGYLMLLRSHDSDRPYKVCTRRRPRCVVAAELRRLTDRLPRGRCSHSTMPRSTTAAAPASSSRCARPRGRSTSRPRTRRSATDGSLPSPSSYPPRRCARTARCRSRRARRGGRAPQPPSSASRSRGSRRCRLGSPTPRRSCARRSAAPTAPSA
jgi:hypothetical protein